MVDDAAVPADALPLLGEPFAVELANSDYATHGVDFLADDLIEKWFAYAAAPARLDSAHGVPRTAAQPLREVRDATRLLLGGIADGHQPARAAAAVHTLNAAARRAPSHLALEVAADTAPSWALHHAGRSVDVLVAQVASRCILFLGGGDVSRVRRCARSQCPMFFVQHHKARRYCHESCAHSVRQARYYRRVHGR